MTRTVLCVQPVAEQGGSDQALLRMARQLTAAGWAVHVALPAPSPMAGELADAGALLHVVPMNRISTSHDLTAWLRYALDWPGSVWHLARLIREVGADVVQSNSLHSWYGWAAAYITGKPHIWNAREIVTQSKAALLVERFLARHFARQVLAASGAVAAQLDPGNVLVVREEADPSEWSPARAGKARRLVGLPDDVVLAGYVGRIDTWKGVDVLLDALSLLAELRPEARAVIAGSPVSGKEAYAEALARRASGLGALWLGPLPGTGAGDLIADLDCVAYPSTSPEPWGLVVVEALACGTPVVATGAGGPAEIMAGLGPNAGSLVPPGDPHALARALALVLPARTSTEMRRSRAPLRTGPAAPYPELFEQVAAGTSRPARRGYGCPAHRP